MSTERIGIRAFEPPEELMANITDAATPLDLSDLLPPERAAELFGAEADTMRARLLAARGPARDALAAVIAGSQARRAALAYDRLTRDHAADLPDDWIAILVRAAGTPRSAGVNGREGILSPIEARNAALACAALSADERDAVAQLMSNASVEGFADASPAQALLLKALAARRKAFSDPDPAARQKALDELTTFASAIQGLDFGRLMRGTSLLDIDETIDTESFDPLSLEDRPGAPTDRPLSYTGADNDGLFQRYEMSCGPSSIEVLLGERDPVYAWRRRAAPLGEDPAPDDDLQTQILKEYGLTPASRVVPAAVVRLRGAMSALESKNQLTHEAARQVSTHLLSVPAGPKGPLVDQALSIVRAANGGFPSPGLTQMILDYAPPEKDKSYSTIGFENMAILLNRIVGERLGVEYKLCSLYAEQGVKLGSEEAPSRSPDFVRTNLDQIAKNLADGIDIVFGTGYPDHFWSMSNVQGEGESRQFLVHDTWSGRTGWVEAPRLVDGSFSRAFLSEHRIYTYIDLLYLVD